MKILLFGFFDLSQNRSFACPLAAFRRPGPSKNKEACFVVRGHDGQWSQFVGFILDVHTRNRFAARFPDPAAAIDLDCWASFEAEAPSTFAAMYQFWVHKPFRSVGGAGAPK